MPATTQPLPKPRRWWPRFTLRVLLVALTLLCVGLGIWTHRARRQKALVEAINRGGWQVSYDFEMEEFHTQVSPIPRMLVDLLGPDFFYEVKKVTVKDRVIVAQLSQLPHLVELAIYDERLTDEDLIVLTHFPNLRTLEIRSNGDPPHAALTRIGDASLILISRLPALKLAWMHGSGFTERGILSLVRSETLDNVVIGSCADSVNVEHFEPLKRTGRIHSLYAFGSMPKGRVTPVGAFFPTIANW